LHTHLDMFDYVRVIVVLTYIVNFNFLYSTTTKEQLFVYTHYLYVSPDIVA
jgi:hypothetical protein